MSNRSMRRMSSVFEFTSKRSPWIFAKYWGVTANPAADVSILFSPTLTVGPVEKKAADARFAVEEKAAGASFSISTDFNVKSDRGTFPQHMWGPQSGLALQR